MSPSTVSLTRRTASTSPGTTVELFQVGSVSELETTYFGMSLKYDANGSSVLSGQYAAHSSYIVRPIRNALLVSMPAPMTAPISSLKYGKCHWSGDSTTPSREMKKFATILPMICSLSVRWSASFAASRPE